MKHTKKDFEQAAARIRCFPAKDRKWHCLHAIEIFKASNPNFNPDLFMVACDVLPEQTPLLNALLVEKAVDIELREVLFTIGYRWNKADVDAALVPHFSVFCGNVKHEVGKDDLAGGGYDAGEADKTPLAGSIDYMQDYLLMKQKWPKDIKSKSISARFIQGYAEVALEYTGPLNKLEPKIAECKEIVKKAIIRFVQYYKGGETLRNSTVNAFAGPGFDMTRIL